MRTTSPGGTSYRPNRNDSKNSPNSTAVSRAMTRMARRPSRVRICLASFIPMVVHYFTPLFFGKQYDVFSITE